MVMLATYDGGGVYTVADKMFSEAGNFYEIHINGEKVAEITVKPTITSDASLEPGWVAVETSKYDLSYQVSPENRSVDDAIEITARLFDGDQPVENADMVWDMAMMRQIDGEWKNLGTMKMLPSYMGDGIYKIQDLMFYEIGNIYDIVVDGETIGQTTVMPTE